MRGHVAVDSEVAVPASALWAVYGGVRLGQLVDKILPDVIGRVEVQGDGGVGTVLKVTLPPGSPGPGYFKEIFTKIDDEKHIKETELLEGGFKELGFEVYRVRFEIMEKDADSSIIRSTIEYDVDDKFGANARLVTTKPLEIITEAVGKYLIHEKDEPKSIV